MKSFWCLSAGAGITVAGLVGSLSASAVELRTPFSFDQSEAGGGLAWISPDAFFQPSSASIAALEPFRGALLIDETPMGLRPGLPVSPPLPNKNPQLFPSVRLLFITVDGDLVPETTDVIPTGSQPGASSAWDIVVEPGRVWAEPMDDGWSRASFPFALVHPSGSERHGGMATFLYRGGEIRELRYQIEQATATPLGNTFTAAGMLPVRFEGEGIANEDAIRARHIAARTALRATSNPATP